MLRFWNTRSYQSKLLLVFCMLCILPAVSIGWLAYQKSVESLDRKVIQDLKVIVGQFDNTIAAQVEGFDRFSTLPYSVEEIIGIVSQPRAPVEDTDFSELSRQQRLFQLIASYPSVNAMIESMVFYGFNGSVYGYRVNGDKSLRSLEPPADEPWYRDAIDRRGGVVISGLRSEDQFVGEPFETISVARMLVDRDYTPAAVISVNVKPDFIGKTVRSLGFQNVHVTVIGPYGYVYSTHPSIAEDLLARSEGLRLEEAKRPVPTSIDSVIDGRSESWSGVRKYNEYTGWTTYLLVDRKELLEESAVIKHFSILVIAFICIGSLMLSWLLARGLSHPIHGLIRSMREVEKGHFTAPAAPINGRRDEFGQLLQSYNRMVSRLEDQVQSIAQSERQKREAELDALRARINPHFLHNTINSIRMLAMLQQSSQIAELLRSLSQLIHANMMLDRELVTLREEIDFLQAYVRLMDLRYTDKFTIEYRIEPSTLSAMVPAMILQPLVENAIFHAPRGIYDRVRIEVSSCAGADGEGLSLRIADDGKGMSRERLDRWAAGDEDGDARGGGIGLRNIGERIRFRFGYRYGLTIRSEEGEGVAVTLHMPFIQGGEGNSDAKAVDGGR